MLSIGARAPEFTLPDHEGRSVSLTSFLGRGALMLYFYPADFTSGCTREACAIRDLHAQVLESGLEVVGVSPQGPQSHRRFRERHALPFTLLSDPEKHVIRAYEADGPLGFGVRRVTYLIDADRHIRSTLLADFRIAAHEAFLRRALAVSGRGS